MRSIDVSIYQENPQPKCQICKDIGHVRLDVSLGHPQFGKYLPCVCQHTSIIARLQELSRITSKERDLRLDVIVNAGIDTMEMVRHAREFLQNPIGIFTIYGTSGNAKSITLLAIVNELVQSQRMAIYVTAFDLFGYVRAAFNSNNQIIDESAYERLKRFENVSVLAIDEFDAVRQTDWVTEQVIDLIDTRHRYGLDGLSGTVIAMNDFDCLPPRVKSRLSDGRNKLCVNNDPDMRPELRREK
jgi:DNA replication protein DnaC